MDIQILLEYNDLWTHTDTKHFDFLTIIKHEEIDELEAIRELTAIRAQAISNRGFDRNIEHYLPKIGKYLCHLNEVISKFETLIIEKQKNKITFQWKTPLYGYSNIYMQIETLDAELAMTMFSYGIAMRQHGYNMTKELIKEPVGDHGSKAIETSKIYCKAAGIFRHININLLPNIEHKRKNINNAAELIPEMCECIENICLAEAQCLVAYRSEEKQSSQLLISSLYVGSVYLFENAIKILRDNSEKFGALSEKLFHYIALASTLCKIRSLKAFAKDQQNIKLSGAAVAYCDVCLDLITKCKTLAEGYSSWKSVFSSEEEEVLKLREIYDSDRVIVYMQQIPKVSDALIDKRIMVKSTEFELNVDSEIFQKIKKLSII